MESTLPLPHDKETPPLDPALFWRWAGRASRPVLGWVLVGLGAIAILIGYFGVSDRVLVAEQIPYLVSGGIGGMVLVIIGGVLLATQDVRRDAERLDDLERSMIEMQVMLDDLHRVLLRPAGAVDNRPAPAVAGASSGAKTATRVNRNGDRVYVVAGGTTFHQDGCEVLDGKDDVSAIAPSSARRRQLTPCLLCEPA